ncbi:MAG: response regulator [Myxococcota bacterium]
MDERLYFLGGGPLKSDLILLVEDNPDDVKQTLRSFAKHKMANEVFVARDGADALDYLFAKGAWANRDATVLPGLILLDLKLPRVTGLQVLARLRAEESTKRIPVVVLTSSSEEPDMIQSYSQGANIFVRKPVDFSNILTAARSLGLYWTLLNSGLTLIHRERVFARSPAACPVPAEEADALAEPPPSEAPPAEPLFAAVPAAAEAEAAGVHRVAEIIVGVDDDNLRRLITITLRVDGHHVRNGKNARDALRLLSSQLPEILILDNQLADINGIEIVRALRETPQGQTVTPILLAADADEATEDLRDPGVPIVAKPVDVLSLADMVREMCPRGSATPRPPAREPSAYDLLGVAEGTGPDLIAEVADSLNQQFAELERQARTARARDRVAAVRARIWGARTHLLHSAAAAEDDQQPATGTNRSGRPA